MNNFAVEAIDGALRTGAEPDSIFDSLDNNSCEMKDIAEYCKAEYALMKSDFNGQDQFLGDIL